MSRIPKNKPTRRIAPQQESPQQKAEAFKKINECNYKQMYEEYKKIAVQKPSQSSTTVEQKCNGARCVQIVDGKEVP